MNENCDLSDSKYIDKVTTVSDDKKEVEEHRNKLLMKLENTIRESVGVSKMTLNEWKKLDMSHYLKVGVCKLGELHKIAKRTVDIDEIRLIHDEYR